MGIDSYEQIVGKDVIADLKRRAKALSDKHIVFVSSTFTGGGVAEMLNCIIPLYNELGLRVGWRIIHGSNDFFRVTKQLHNALQGGELHLSTRKKRIYTETNRQFSTFTHLDHDLVMVHDPQPLPLISYCKKKQPWALQLHLDLTHPDESAWNYLKKFIQGYDHLVLLNREYAKNDVKVPQSFFAPAIDPLATKNKQLSQEEMKKILEKYKISTKKPFIAQVSRFDSWKDPMGVIEIFEKVRQSVDCQLVLLGSSASDDPEGPKLYEEVMRRARASTRSKDIHVLLVVNDVLVNAVQTCADVILQKSLREGFGLVVSEALFKKTPVVASRVGGIPLQVIDGDTGFLNEPTDIAGFAANVVKLMKDKPLRATLGERGRDHVKNHFLITRLMGDWLEVFEQLLKKH